MKSERRIIMAERQMLWLDEALLDLLIIVSQNTRNGEKEMKLKVLATLLCLIVSSSLCAAPIEKWVDENGKTHYGVRAPDNAASTTVSRTTTITSSKLENVVLYSTSWCGYCKKARSYMRRNGIAFVDYDIEENASAKFNYDQMGGRGVPFIVKGDRVLRGFSVKRYRQFFKN